MYIDTVPTLGYKHESLLPQPRSNPPRRRRRVRFAKQQDIEYHTNTQLSREDVANLWYTPDEYAGFYQEMRDIITSARQAEAYYSDLAAASAAQSSSHYHQHWRTALLTVYGTFRTAKSPTQIQPVLDAIHCHNIVLDEHVVGLERMGMTAITRDFAQRRNELLHQIYSLQYGQHALSPDMRALYIRDAVEYYSRPARLYARYVAYLAAGLCWEQMKKTTATTTTMSIENCYPILVYSKYRK